MMINDKQQSATNYFLQGFNCCQSVLLAFNDILKVDQETLKTSASGFGGGMGRLREVCGAFSGMVMMAGFISPAADPSIKEDRTKNYALVQQFAEKFKELNGGSMCAVNSSASPKTPQKNRPCLQTALPNITKKAPAP